MSEATYPILNGRDIYEVANQLGGYVDPGTPEHLARFLLREAAAASDLADEIIRLQSALASATRECEQSRKTIADLREALAPFAKAANDIERQYGDDVPDGQLQFPPLEMRYFRRARAALQGGNDG